MSAPYPVDLYPGCPCFACDQKPRIDDLVAGKPWRGLPNRLSLCPTCGSKRCLGALDHNDHEEEGPSA